MAVRIITDSTCDLPARIIAEFGIQVIPLYIHVDGEDYLDGIDMTRDQFYARLPEFKDHPRTAVPSLLKFRTMYDAMAERGASEVLSIHISSTLSAIANVARSAAKETTSVPVTVLDSGQLSLGTGFQVHTAAMLARAGKSVKEILVALEDQAKRTYVAAALDTLKFLQKSGRMNVIISTIGEIIDLKPILKMHDGVSSVEKVRTHKKAVQRLVDTLRSYGPFERLAVLYSGSMEHVQAFKDEIQDLLPSSDTWVEMINPVLGAHIGPGVIGFACVSRSLTGGFK
jgi:DegV family protein with EDD domain